MEYTKIVSSSSLPLRVKKEFYTYRPELNFFEKEFIAILSKSGSDGLMIISSGNDEIVLRFQMRKIAASSLGRKKPIICDLCFCWLPGSKVSMITFPNVADKLKSHTFYCCSKLNCSENVRERTIEYAASNVQLHENITVPERIERLEKSINKIVKITSV